MATVPEEKPTKAFYTVLNGLNWSASLHATAARKVNIEELPEVVRPLFLHMKEGFIAIATDVNELYNQTGWPRAFQAGARSERKKVALKIAELEAEIKRLKG